MKKYWNSVRTSKGGKVLQWAARIAIVLMVAGLLCLFVEWCMPNPAPAGTNPTTPPAATQPTTPEGTQPEQPDATQPEQPDATQPEQPDATQPEQPDGTQSDLPEGLIDVATFDNGNHLLVFEDGNLNTVIPCDGDDCICHKWHDENP